MSLPNIPTPVMPEWIKLYNSYDPEHYMPGKRVSAEEWNTLFLASVRQGNYNADTLELLVKQYLPDTYQTIADFDKFAALLRGDFEVFKAQSKDIYTTFTTQIQKDFTDLSGEVEVFKSRVIHAEDVAFSLDATIQEANQYAQQAVNIAETADTISQNALATAYAAVTTSDTALSTAEKADTTSQTALSNSQESVITANTAATQSAQAVNTANAASLRADDAIVTANAAKIESASAKSVADTAAANSTTALSTSQEAKNTADTAEQIAQSALDLVTEGVGSQVLVNGVSVDTFNADTKADVTYVNQKIDDIMGPGSTEAIDTILELAAAFKNNSDVIKVLNEAISTKANASDLDNYVTKTGYTMRASTTVGEFYYNTGAGEKAIQVKMPSIPVTSVNGLTGDVVIDTSKYVTSDALSAVTDATLSDDSKTLTITKRDGTSFDFQGGGDVDLSGYIPQGGTLTAPLKVTGGDQATSGKIILDETNKGQITNTGTGTLFGFNDSDTLSIGHANYNMSLRGKGARPKYQNKDMAFVSDALPNFTITISHHSAGNPRMVKFVSVNYSSKATCFKMAAMTCHDNGVSYQFLTDMLIAVTAAGEVTANIYKFAQREIDSVDGVARYTGDVFYVNDTTNKIVDFYILCGQWSASQFTPVTKVGSTTIDYVTQYSGNATYYSSGTKTWVNGCGTTYARLSDLNNKLSLDGSNTMTGVLNLKASGANETNIGANGIRWNLDSLPQSITPEYVCVIDGFAIGGRQKWSTVLDVYDAMRKVVTPNWHVSQDGSGNLVFRYA